MAPSLQKNQQRQEEHCSFKGEEGELGLQGLLLVGLLCDLRRELSLFWAWPPALESLAETFCPSKAWYGKSGRPSKGGVTKSPPCEVQPSLASSAPPTSPGASPAILGQTGSM